MVEAVEIVSVRCASRAMPGPVDLEVRAEGLAFADGVKRRREVGWAEITKIDRVGGTLVIRTAGRSHYLIMHSVRECSTLVQELRLRRWEALRVDQASPERIAGWLGIPTDGALVCQPPPWLWPLTVLGLGGWLLLAVALQHNFLLANVLLQTGLWSALGLFAAGRVRADVDGLVVTRAGRRAVYAWSEVREVRYAGPRCIVSTTSGSFVILHHNAEGERLCAAIEQAIAAREAGLSLPTLAPVSDTALSRMTGDADPSIQRGLTVSELGET
jgi:hypothetical protein